MGFDRERSIIAQNAGTTAAALTGHLISAGAIDPSDEDAVVSTFESMRAVVFQGTLGYAEVGPATPAAAPAAAPQNAEQAAVVIEGAFGGATVAQPFTMKGAVHGELPAWLGKEFAYQQGKGKVAADDTELYDNRDRLPQFGGTGNAKAPWFRTAKGKVGLWPPKALGG